MHQYKLENIKKLPNVGNKPIWSALMNNEPIIIKKYECYYLDSTIIEKNNHVAKEITNEVNMLKYIEKTVRFPDGIKVPKSLSACLENPISNKKEIEAFHCIEKLPGQDLFDWMETNLKLQYSEKQQLLRKIVEQLALAIYTLHKYNIIHGDIKLDNTMIDVLPTGEINLGLIDFAFSTLVNSSNLIQTNKKCAKEYKNFSGTLDYISPELSLQIVPYDLFGNDVWCFAMTVYSLYTGYFIDRPYDTVKEQVDKCIEYCDYSFKRDELPLDIYKLLRLIFIEEDKRIGMEEIIKYLGIDLMDIDL